VAEHSFSHDSHVIRSCDESAGWIKLRRKWLEATGKQDIRWSRNENTTS